MSAQVVPPRRRIGGVPNRHWVLPFMFLSKHRSSWRMKALENIGRKIPLRQLAIIIACAFTSPFFLKTGLKQYSPELDEIAGMDVNPGDGRAPLRPRGGDKGTPG